MKISPESDKTQKSREKLAKRLEEVDKLNTEDNLNKKVVEIHESISRYASSRVSLNRKSISLFDNNENSADFSKKVANISASIEENARHLQNAIEHLTNALQDKNIYPLKDSID